MILADTGVLVAIMNSKDKLHAVCDALWDDPRGPFLVSPLVVAEVCYFLARRTGPKIEADFIESFPAGQLVLARIVERDMARMADLVRKYHDFGRDGLGGADASVIALAERLDINVIATTDRRHFQAIRPAHCGALTLLPDGLA